MHATNSLFAPQGHLLKGEEGEDTQFAIVFAAMGVNMETAHFFKQVCTSCILFWLLGVACERV